MEKGLKQQLIDIGQKLGIRTQNELDLTLFIVAGLIGALIAPDSLRVVVDEWPSAIESKWG